MTPLSDTILSSAPRDPTRRAALIAGTVLATAAASRVLADASPAKKTLGIVLYPDFETLDVFGPAEMWGYGPGLKVVLVAQHAGAVRSTQGVSAAPDFDFASCPQLDLMMVPGGNGTFTELKNPVFLDFLRTQDRRTELTMSVCSGAALLGEAGLLDGRRATTNKFQFSRLTTRQTVTWVKRARWVEDGKYITSSGVAAGTDMACALLAKLYGVAAVRSLTHALEYAWNDDANNDPFAIA